MTKIMKNYFISTANAQLVSLNTFHFTALLEINHPYDTKLVFQTSWQELNEPNF